MPTNTISDLITTTIKDVLQVDKAVGLHEPIFLGNESAYLKECIDTGWVSYRGSFVDKFECQLAALSGVKHCICTSSGTTALHIALITAGVTSGDEVLMPALTFVATANAASYIGAKPVFMDCADDNPSLCPAKLKSWLAENITNKNGQSINKNSGRRVAAIVPVHIFGNPIDMSALMPVAEEFSIPIVEDAAQAVGSYYKGKHMGGFGLVGILSFNGNKIITTGGGGALLTNDDKVAERAMHLSTTAKVPHKWEFMHDEIGYNYRMPNVNAAIGCGQLETLDEILRRKRLLAERYKDAFVGIGGVSFLEGAPDCTSNHWLNGILLDEADMTLRDAVLEKTNSIGLMTRPLWKNLSEQPMYEKCERADLSSTKSFEARLISLPSSAGLA